MGDRCLYNALDWRREALMKNREKGSEIIEFALVFMPFIAMLTVLMDVGWAIFVKSTMQQAVRAAVDQGVQMQNSQIASGACLTDTVKGLVEQNSLGILNGASGLSYIKVNYFQPPAAGSNGAATDVSTQTDADTSGNVMQVSVQNYSLLPLLPRVVSLSQGVDNSPLNLSVYASGVIQMTMNASCVGTAP
jgi:Flp pilus assembly protein TadG